MNSVLKIYTRTGDKGQTSLYGGKRVEKHAQQVVAYGTVDELNSALGVVIAHLPDPQKDLHLFLTRIQKDLFTIGAYLAGNNQPLDAIGKRVPEIEKTIDNMDKALPPLKNFILPGGCPAGAFAHLARAIARRAEREIIRLSKEHGVGDPKIIMYVNRLSDFLFILARHLNAKSGIPDTVWKGNTE